MTAFQVCRIVRYMANKNKVTRNKDGTPRKQGSGRTAGSYSFVKIPLSQILAKFADKETPITVGRKWAEMCGFQIAETTDANHLYQQIQGATPDTKVEAEVIEQESDE